MTLPTGTITMNDVNLELGKASGALISLNDADVRALAEKPSGTISMDDLRGKSAQPKAVSLIGQSSNATRTLTLSGISVGDMLFAATSSLTSTSGLLTGYTSILLQRNTTFNRSMRCQYKIATSTSETITWTGSSGCLVAIPGMSTTGQARGRFYQTATSVSLVSSTFSGWNTSGTSFLIGGVFINGDIASVSSPFSILSSTSYSGSNANYSVAIPGNTKSSFGTSDTVITRANGLSFPSGFTYLIELLP